MDTQSMETPCLIIRTFVPDDLPDIHRILDQAFGDGSKVEDAVALAERRSWLTWSALNQEWLPKLDQPPYGDRAITLKATGAVIGAVGYVPLLDGFEQIPELATSAAAGSYNTPEVGLFWAIDPLHQGQGYATEAARALIDHAFQTLRLKRILATTDYSNVASQRVMQKLGMKIARHPSPEPPSWGIVGILVRPG